MFYTINLALTSLLAMLWLDTALASTSYSIEMPEGAHSTCWDANNYLWVGGIFNLAGSDKALNIARYNPSTKVWDTPIGVGVNASFELITANDDLSDEELAGVVKVLKCPSSGNYVYIGGFFSYAFRNTDAIAAGSNNMALTSHYEVNNYFRYDTVEDVIEPLYKSSSDQTQANNGFTKVHSNDGYVAAVECINADCSQAYVGGSFDSALGTSSLKNIVLLNTTTSWDSPTVTRIGLSSSNFDGEACSDPVYGADGIVLSISVISDLVVLIGGIFLKAGCSLSSALVRYKPLDDKIECIQSGTPTVCGASATAMALCCVSLAGPVYTIERVSKTAAVVGGEFDMYSSAGNEISGAALITQSDSSGSSYVGGGTIAPIYYAYPSYFDGIGKSFFCADWQSTNVYCNVGYLGYEANSTETTLPNRGLYEVTFNSWSSATSSNEPTGTTLVNIVPIIEKDQVSTNNANNGTFVVNAFTQDPSSTTTLYLAGQMDIGADVILLDRNSGTGDLLADDVPYDVDHAGLPLGYSACFTESNGTAEDRISGVGVNWCCANGHICPAAGVSIPCDLDYGFYCPLNAVSVDCCAEGYYCPWPGEQILCPMGYYCPIGSTEPTKCSSRGSFAICSETGLASPKRVDSTFLALFMTMLIFVATPLCISYVYNAASAQRAELIAAFVKAKQTAYKELLAAEAKVVGAGDGDGDGDGSTLKSEGIELSDIEKAPSSTAATDSSPNNKSDDNADLKMSSIPVEERASIEFQDLFVSLQSRNKTKYLLKDISGVLQAGSVTAVMGPSGCGKTTFLSALSDRINGGKVGGVFKTNGKIRPLSSLKNFLGFVPQEDVMHRDLTVYQVLKFQCALRADKDKYPHNSIEQEEKVHSVISILGLMHVKDSLIGDENRRGISGGQRKRVNIGMELVQDPKILFLDEPTSGLDSTTTVELLEYLHKYAHTGGLSISLVIHQPRVECLQYLDNVVLLKPTPDGGRAVYIGNMQDAIQHLSDVGLPCPPGVNPTDYFLDVMSDKSARTNKDITLEEHWTFVAGEVNKRSLAAQEKSLVEAAKNSVASVLTTTEIADRANLTQPTLGVSLRGATSGNSSRSKKVPTEDDEDDDDKGWVWNPPSILTQIRVQFARSMQQQYNNLVSVVSNYLFLCFVGILIAGLNMLPVTEFFMVVLAIGLTSALQGVKIFGSELAIAAREDRSGLSTSAYFIGKIMATLPNALLNPLCFLSVYIYMGSLDIYFSDYLKILFGCTLINNATGVMISLLVVPSNAQVTATLISLVMVCFSGNNPTVAEMELERGLPYVASQISYARWGLVSLILQNTKRMSMCAKTAVLPELYESGMVTRDCTGYVTQDDLDSLDVDVANEYGSLVGLACGFIILSGLVIWLLSVYGEGVANTRYKLRKLRHKLIKETNVCSNRYLGYNLIDADGRGHPDSVGKNAREAHDHDDQRYHDRVNEAAHWFG